jgi:exopolysaccharide biosynthesis polyprenyl glycosylphosphotransferase
MYRLKQLTILIIDLLVLYASFFLTLFIRSGETTPDSLLGLLPHISLLYGGAVVILFIVGLYDLPNNRNTFAFYRKLIMSAVIWAMLGVLYFYLNPRVAVAPKTILLLNTLIGFGALALWRYLHNRFLSTTLWKYTIVFAGVTPEALELITLLNKEPQRGFKVLGIIDPENSTQETSLLPSAFHPSLSGLKTQLDTPINLIVIAPHLAQNEILLKELYAHIFDQIEMISLAEFYERVTGRIPGFTFSEAWFLTNLREQRKKVYDRFRILIDYFCAVIIGVIFILTFPFIAPLVKLTHGPIFLRQKRIGRLGKEFTFIKYRSMVALTKDGSAEIAGAQFTSENDPRITPVGRILRKIRLDELPQCINILQGHMGIVGPRPERPHFVEQLTHAMPFYALRHVVKPGLTGWASISESYYGTIDENLRKLEYDLYYVKNRGFLLDIVIILKTVRTMIGMKGR